jgi:hypothetical protein
MGKVGGNRNFGFGRKMVWASSPVLHHRAPASDLRRGTGRYVEARERESARHV